MCDAASESWLLALEPGQQTLTLESHDTRPDPLRDAPQRLVPWVLDQNFVAGLIAGKHVNPDKAAQQWIAANKAKVNVWLGK